MGLLLLFFPQQGQPSIAGVNLALAESDLWPALNATSSMDAIFWAQSDIYEWFDEAAKNMARKIGAFVNYDTSITIAEGTNAYTLPATHINTVEADIAGLVLKPRNIQELEALDASWPTTEDPVDSFIEDQVGMDTFTTYPIPDASDDGKTLGLVMQAVPADITTSNAFVGAPGVLREYFTFSAIAEARAKESPAQMKEIAQWLRGVVDMMDQTLSGIWAHQ